MIYPAITINTRNATNKKRGCWLILSGLLQHPLDLVDFTSFFRRHQRSRHQRSLMNLRMCYGHRHQILEHSLPIELRMSVSSVCSF